MNFGPILRSARFAYDNGNPEPLKAALVKLGEELKRMWLEDETDDRHDAIVTSLVEHLVEQRDAVMLIEVLALPISIPFRIQTIEAASVGWKEGYDLLRETLRDTPVVGITLFYAFKMNDASAYEPDGEKQYQIDTVNDFLKDVAAAGMASDDALDFVAEVGMAWTIDASLGLKDQYDRSLATTADLLGLLEGALNRALPAQTEANKKFTYALSAGCRNRGISRDAGPRSCTLFCGKPGTAKLTAAMVASRHLFESDAIVVSVAQFPNYSADDLPAEVLKVLKNAGRGIVVFDEFEKASARMVFAFLNALQEDVLSRFHVVATTAWTKTSMSDWLRVEIFSKTFKSVVEFVDPS